MFSRSSNLRGFLLKSLPLTVNNSQFELALIFAYHKQMLTLSKGELFHQWISSLN